MSLIPLTRSKIKPARTVYVRNGSSAGNALTRSY